MHLCAVCCSTRCSCKGRPDVARGRSTTTEDAKYIIFLCGSTISDKPVSRSYAPLISCPPRFLELGPPSYHSLSVRSVARHETEPRSVVWIEMASIERDDRDAFWRHRQVFETGAGLFHGAATTAIQSYSTAISHKSYADGRSAMESEDVDMKSYRKITATC